MSDAAEPAPPPEGAKAPEKAEEHASPQTKEEAPPLSWPLIASLILGALASLYVFLLGLQLLGDAFKSLGGKGAGSLFGAIENPVAGLMTGVLATVLVQSSSTSTSIVVGLVGAEQITVRTAIPVVMGANIGTSVTNTLVSMGHVGDRIELQRAFAGATVHDMFNYLSVAVLLPLEVIVGAVQGEGGVLYWLTKAMTERIMGGKKGSAIFHSPIETITKPVTGLVIENDKHVIHALSLGAPEARRATPQERMGCRRLAAEAVDSASGGRALLSRPLGCEEYYCISKTLDGDLREISSREHAMLTGCSGRVTPEKCDGVCYTDVGVFYEERVTKGKIISGGFVQGAGDTAGGAVALVLSLLLMMGGLFFLTKCLQRLFMGKAKRVIARATRLNDYLALLVGAAMTVVAQSSSVVTSALTPFCGLGVISLEKMLPMTLGANIGTTVTALIAAFAKFTESTVHIALCHLMFNVMGIMIWFPVPFMRQAPLNAARLLGLYASFYRVFPMLYILVCFVVVPGAALAVAALFEASVAGGVGLLLVIVGALGAFEFWWVWREGCYRVISKEDREKGRQACEAVQKEILGDTRV